MWQLLAEIAPGANPPVDLSGWLQTAGSFVLSGALLTFAKTAYQRETKRVDKLEQALEETQRQNREDREADQKYIRETVLPAMQTSAQAVREATEVLRKNEERRRRGDSRD